MTTLPVRLRAHLAILRLDHSIKNVFILPGIAVPLSLLHARPEWRRVVVGLLAATLIACSNYVVNEVLDAPYDRLHPVKSQRPVACNLVNVPLAYGQWLLMMVAGMLLAGMLGWRFALAAGALWVMGCVYNIRPLRTKDVVFLDVLTESVNNPLRMLLGWYMVTAVLVPPVSLLIAYWMLGCYFMGLKRFSEFRELGSGVLAGQYRRSFRGYTEQSLLGSVMFYASVSMLMFGAFIMRYRLELILSFPLIAVLMAMYFNLAFKPESAVQHPEKLYRQGPLMVTTMVTAAAITALLYLDVPAVGRMFAPSVVGR